LAGFDVDLATERAERAERPGAEARNRASAKNLMVPPTGDQCIATPEDSSPVSVVGVQ
jgi:hypothetical protein